MDVTPLLEPLKLRARIDFADDDADLLLSLSAALLDVMSAANVDVPSTAAEIPADLHFAIIDQAAMLYDSRGPDTDRPLGLSMAASRIVARYRGVQA